MLAPALALILFFAQLPVVGFSPMTLLTLGTVALVAIQLTIKPATLTFVSSLQPVLLLFTLFFLTLATSFAFNSNMAGPEWRYLIDWLLAVIWLPLMFVLVRLSYGRVLNVIRRTSMLVSLLLALSIIVVIAIVGDLFFLRSEIDLPILSSTLIATPNITARTSLGLLMIVQLFIWNAASQNYSLFALRFVQIALIVVLLASLSRAGLAALLLFFILLNFRKDGADAVASIGRVLSTLVVLVALSGIVILTSEAARTRVDQAFDIVSNVQTGTAKGARAKTWLASSQIVSENPLLGIGVENTRLKLAEYGSIKTKISTQGQTEKIVVAVHGGFLEIMVYGGAVALFFFALFFLGLLLWSAMLALNAPSAVNRNAAALATIYLTLLIPLNIAAGNLRNPFTWMVLGVLLACAFHSDTHSDNPQVT